MHYKVQMMLLQRFQKYLYLTTIVTSFEYYLNQSFLMVHLTLN